jgi:hypothetical protein
MRVSTVFYVNSLMPELNPSAQRRLPRFLLRILIFKGLSARRLCKSFNVKGLTIPIFTRIPRVVLSNNFKFTVMYVSILYSSLMGNLDSSVGTVKGWITDGWGSILASFNALFSFLQRPGRLEGPPNILFSGYLWLFPQG